MICMDYNFMDFHFIYFKFWCRNVGCRIVVNHASLQSLAPFKVVHLPTFSSSFFHEKKCHAQTHSLPPIHRRHHTPTHTPIHSTATTHTRQQTVSFSAVWPDEGIKSSQIFPKIFSKSSHIIFYSDSYTSEMAKKVSRYLVYYCRKNCLQYLSKITQSGHTVSPPLVSRCSHFHTRREPQRDHQPGRDHQCVQMSKLFFQFLAIYNSKSLHSSTTVFAKVSWHFLRLLNKPSNNCQRLMKFYQSRKNSLIWSHWPEGVLAHTHHIPQRRRLLLMLCLHTYLGTSLPTTCVLWRKL